jgi:hypothetical protein
VILCIDLGYSGYEHLLDADRNSTPDRLGHGRFALRSDEIEMAEEARGNPLLDVAFPAKVRPHVQRGHQLDAALARGQPADHLRVSIVGMQHLGTHFRNYLRQFLRGPEHGFSLAPRDLSDGQAGVAGSFLEGRFSAPGIRKAHHCRFDARTIEGAQPVDHQRFDAAVGHRVQQNDHADLAGFRGSASKVSILI